MKQTKVVCYQKRKPQLRNNDRWLSLDDKTKDYVHRNTVGLVHSLHDMQLG